MAMYFIVREADEVIINSVMWDGVSPWRPDAGTYLEPFITGVGIGHKKVDGQWINPEPQEIIELEQPVEE